MVFVGAETQLGFSWVLFDRCAIEFAPQVVRDARQQFGPSAGVLMVHHYPGGPMPQSAYSAEALREFLFAQIVSNAGSTGG